MYSVRSLRYGHHHQQPQQRSHYDKLDPLHSSVRKPSNHFVEATHGQPPAILVVLEGVQAACAVCQTLAPTYVKAIATLPTIACPRRHGGRGQELRSPARRCVARRAAVCVSASGDLLGSRANAREACTRISRRSGGLRPDRCNGSRDLGCWKERYLIGLGRRNDRRSLPHAIHAALSHTRDPCGSETHM
jgi:hypothetical protein